MVYKLSIQNDQRIMGIWYCLFPPLFSSKTAFGLLATIPHRRHVLPHRLMNHHHRFLNLTQEVKRNSVYFFLLPSAFNSAAPSRDQSMPRPSPLDGISDGVNSSFICNTPYTMKQNALFLPQEEKQV